jgi:hypothetical protein
MVRKANVIALSFLLVQGRPDNMSVNLQATRGSDTSERRKTGQAALEEHQTE